jgi:hypothetical protein
MNQADKDEALRLLADVADVCGWSPDLASLRTLIERQSDEDGERWRFCLEHGFPWLAQNDSGHDIGFGMTHRGKDFVCDAPTEAVDAAHAATKERG